MTSITTAIETATQTASRAGAYAYIHEQGGVFHVSLVMPLEAASFHAVCPRSGEVSRHSAF